VYGGRGDRCCDRENQRGEQTLHSCHYSNVATPPIR
jgi:hypothetical protein